MKSMTTVLVLSLSQAAGWSIVTSARSTKHYARTNCIVAQEIEWQSVNIEEALEACILAAQNEDGVQHCLSEYDTSQEEQVTTLQWSSIEEMLESCILAAHNEDGVQHCLSEYDASEEDQEITPVEAYMLNSKHEHAEKASIERTDSAEKDTQERPASGSERRTALGLCLDDATSKYDIQECVALSDNDMESSHG